jgi:hypothetical protein
MASQYSILRNYGKYVSPYNMDVMMQGMGYMQQKIDTNRQAINEYVDSIINSDIIKPQDREYLLNRLNGLIQDVNNVYRKSNLASDGIARSIQARLGEALDTRVLNAIAGTREYRSFSQKIEDMKLNNPKQYSAINGAVALLPFYEWVNDGQVGTRMNPIHYTPYTDYNEEMNKMMKDFVSLNKGKKFSVPEIVDGKPTGRMRNITVDEMSQSQIRSIAARSISQNAKAQMQIEGQYLAMTNPSMFSGMTTEQFVNKYVSGFDAEESVLLAKLKGAEASPSAKAAIEASLQEVREQRRALVEEATSFIGNNMNPARAGEFIVRNEFLDGVSARWSYNNSSESYSADDYYFKVRDLDFKEREFSWRQKSKEIDQNLKLREIKTKEGGNSPGASSGVMIELEKVQPNVTPENIFDNQYIQNENNISTGEKDLISSLNPVDLRGIENDIQNNPSIYPGGVNSENIMAWITNNGGGSSSVLSSPEMVGRYEALMAANDNRKKYSKIMDEEVDYLTNAFDVATKNILNDAIKDQNYVTGGIDTYTDNGMVNARDVGKNGAVIGGKEYSAEDALKISSLIGLISENIDYVGHSADDNELMRSYVGLLNRYTGQDFTSEDIIEFSKVFKYLRNPVMKADISDLSDKDKILRIIGFNMLRANGPTLRREWSSSNVGRNIAKAVQDSKTVYERRYDEFAPRSWSFSNSTNASKEDRRMHAKLESLLLARAGFLNKDKDSRLNNYILYARPTDNPNTFDLVAMAGGENIATVQVTKEELDSMGYSLYERERNVRSEDYESKIIPVSFSATTNRPYQKWAQANSLGAFATVENAAEEASRMVDKYDIQNNDLATSELNKRAIRIINTVLRNYKSYDVKAKGFPGGVEVGIYFHGQAKTGTPLKVLEYNTDYADNIMKIINMCPQMYLTQAVVEAINKDVIVKGRDINEQHSDLSNLLSVLDKETIDKIDGKNEQQQ